MDTSGIPSFRGIAHIIAFDPGLYYKTQYGCVAYIGGNDTMPYKCCNRTIEDFDLQESRSTLLQALIVPGETNFNKFVHSLMCRHHRGETSGPSRDKTVYRWIAEIGCKADDHARCVRCSLLKPRPRWDAGFKDQFVPSARKTRGHKDGTDASPIPMTNSAASTQPSASVQTINEPQDVAPQEIQTTQASEHLFTAKPTRSPRSLAGVGKLAVLVSFMVMSLALLLFSRAPAAAEPSANEVPR